MQEVDAFQNTNGEVLLCEAVYVPCSMGIGAIRLIGQIVTVCGEDLMWMDGIDFDDPVLVPLANLQAVKELGSFADFLALYEEEVVALAMCEDFTDVSPTLLTRAVINMREGENDPRSAMSLARIFSGFVREVDEIDRTIFDKVVEDTVELASRASTQTATWAFQ